MSDPAVLVPSGLAQVHPQLETSIKSIASAINALQRGAKVAAATPAGAGGTADLTVLQQQLQVLQGQVNGIDRGRGFALFCS